MPNNCVKVEEKAEENPSPVVLKKIWNKILWPLKLLKRPKNLLVFF